MRFLTSILLMVFLLFSCGGKKDSSPVVRPDEPSETELDKQIAEQRKLIARLKEKYKEDKEKLSLLESKDNFSDFLNDLYDDSTLSSFGKNKKLLQFIHDYSTDEDKVASITDKYYIKTGNSMFDDADVIFLGDIHTNSKIQLFAGILLNNFLIKYPNSVIIREGRPYNSASFLQNCLSYFSRNWGTIDYSRTNPNEYLSNDLSEISFKYFNDFWNQRRKLRSLHKVEDMPLLMEKRCTYGDLSISDSIQARNETLAQAISYYHSLGHKVIVTFGNLHLPTPFFKNYQQVCADRIDESVRSDEIKNYCAENIDELIYSTNKNFKKERKEIELLYKTVSKLKYAELSVGQYDKGLDGWSNASSVSP